MWGTSLTVTKDFGDNYTVKSVTAYREQESEFSGDQDHSPLRYMETTNTNEHEQFSQEIMINGVSANGRFDWLIGGFYMHEEGSDVYDVVLGGGIFNVLEMLPFALLPLGAGFACPPPPGVMLPCAGGAGNPFNVALDLEASVENDIDIDSYAAFGHASYDLSDRFTATAGVRYSYDSKELTTMVTRMASGAVAVPRTTISNNWERFTPMASLKYQFSDDAMAYASVTRGYKSGGFNGRALSVAEIDTFNPEQVWAYEVGTKAKMLDNRVQLSMAAFYSDYTDMQLLSVRDAGGLIVVVTENAGKVDIKGFEAEVAALLTDELRVNASIGFLDAKYDSLAPGATITLDDELVKAPKWTANAAFDYTIPLDNGAALSIGGSASYRSKCYNELTNLEVLAQDGYVLLSARMTYEHNENWSLTVFGRNLSDKRYKTNGLHALGSFGSVDAVYGPPREWGVKARALF